MMPGDGRAARELTEAEAARIGLGLSLEAMAARIGVTAKRLRAIERGQILPHSLTRLDRLAAWYGCSAHVFSRPHPTRGGQRPHRTRGKRNVSGKRAEASR